MYLYSFTKFGGFDRVFRYSEVSTSLSGVRSMKAGDLILWEGEYFLCLGKKLAFEELYLTAPTIRSEGYIIVYKAFLSSLTLSLLHRMVETYYTTYKSVVKYFLSEEVEKLLKREGKMSGKGKKRGKNEEEEMKIGENGVVSNKIARQGQTLIVYPDLRTMENGKEEESFFRNEVQSTIKSNKIDEKGKIVTLLPIHTQNQKDTHRWQIKRGQISVILCTYAEIFQDFHDLRKIIWVDPHKWYYANQQDPRYKVGDVLEKMAQLRGAEIESLGI